MSTKKLCFFLAVSFVASAIIVQAWKPRSYVEALVRIQTEEVLGGIDRRIKEEPLAVQGLLLDYSGNQELTLKAWIALARYPDISREILMLYGAEPEFKEVLQRYGEAVMPVIHFFMANDIWSVRAGNAIRERTASAMGWATRLIRPDTGEPTATAPAAERESGPTSRGWAAVHLIRKEGHDLLGEFVVTDDQTVKWNQTARFTNAITAFFSGGIRTLETKRDLGEEVGAKDWFWAGLDVATVALPLKLLRAGRVSNVSIRSGEGLSVTARTRLFAPRLLLKNPVFQRLGKYGAVAATVVIIARHPGLITSLLGELAAVLGLPAWLVQSLGWSLLITLLLYPLFWVMKPVARLVLSGLAALEGAGRRARPGLGMARS